jgi:hypothetical protein
MPFLLILSLNILMTVAPGKACLAFAMCGCADKPALVQFIDRDRAAFGD